MKRLLILVFFMSFITLNTYGQRDDRELKKREAYEKEMQEKQDEYISDFISSLSIDDFQKEILSQKLQSYFNTKKAIIVADIESYKRKEYLDELDRTHFLDIKSIFNEDIMNSIDDFIKGEYKKKNKKKSKKSKNNP